MNKNIEIKKVSNGIIRDIPINIDDIVGKNKNITIEATLIDYRVFKLNNTTTTILNLKDNTGSITGLLVGECSILSKNEKYKFKGNVVIIENTNLEEFNQLIEDDIKKYIIGNKLFCIKLIQPVNSNPLLSFIELSLHHNNCDDLVELRIPITSVEKIGIDKISKSLVYSKNGKYIEYTKCSSLELRLILSKLDEKIIKTLSEDINIFSIGLFFDNKDKKIYNLPYYSCDGLKNELQHIDKDEDKLIIHIDEDLK